MGIPDDVLSPRVLVSKINASNPTTAQVVDIQNCRHGSGEAAREQAGVEGPPSPQAIMEREQLAERLWKAVDELPEGSREGELSAQETVDYQGASQIVSKAYAAEQAAVAKLREALAVL